MNVVLQDLQFSKLNSFVLSIVDFAIQKSRNNILQKFGLIAHKYGHTRHTCTSKNSLDNGGKSSTLCTSTSTLKKPCECGLEIFTM